MREPAAGRGTASPAVASTRRVVGVFALAFLLIAGSLVAFNVVLDPRAEFGTGLVEPLVATAEAHQKRVLFEGMVPRAQTLILGSSRAMTLPPAVFDEIGHGPAFNFGLSASTTHDALAIYRYAEERGHLREVVMGVEVDHFVGARVDHFAARRPGTWNASPGWVWERGPIPAVEAIVGSYETTSILDGLASLRYLVFGYPEPATKYDADGLFHDVAWEAGEPRPPLDPAALQAEVAARVERFEGDGAFVAARVDPLRALVAEARSRGTNITLFLTPMRPELLGALVARTDYTAIRAEALAGLERGCGAGVRVFDFSELAGFAGNADDFRDAVHYGPDNARALVHALYERSDLCANPDTVAP